MSSRGEIIPELAVILREIAGRIEQKTATPEDARRLFEIARHASGDDSTWCLELHSKAKGRSALGGEGVDRRFAMAKLLKDHVEKHGCTNDAAYEALDGTMGVSRHALEDAWQEMGPLLDMKSDFRDFILMSKRREARGWNVRVTRKKA